MAIVIDKKVCVGDGNSPSGFSGDELAAESGRRAAEQII
jgi:hypothetical protein